MLPHSDMDGNRGFVRYWLWADGALGESEYKSNPLGAELISLPSKFGKESWR
jgi:hypothetical protein